MSTAIVTIQRNNEVRDVEVPLEISTAELIQQLALALAWPAEIEVFADPPSRVLTPQETLAQAGILDGARLIFQPVGTRRQTAPPSSSAPSPAPPTGGPVSGWRPLDISPSSAAEEAPPSPPAQGGFVWKQIDED